MDLNNRILKVNEKDNVAVALNELSKGTQVKCDGETIELKTTIPQKHKFACKSLDVSDPVFMYGVLVGEALKPIPKGGLLSTENVRHKTQKVVGKNAPLNWTPPDTSIWKTRTFRGYHRSDGQVGTENIWLFFPLVFCENRNIETLKNIFEKEFNPPEKEPLQDLLSQLISGKLPEASSIQTPPIKSKPFENIKVRFITHQGGFGGTREDAQALARLLAGYVNNPNVAGASVLSLGCQHLEI